MNERNWIKVCMKCPYHSIIKTLRSKDNVKHLYCVFIDGGSEDRKLAEIVSNKFISLNEVPKDCPYSLEHSIIGEI